MGLPLFVDDHRPERQLALQASGIVDVQSHLGVEWGSPVRAGTADDRHEIAPEADIQNLDLAAAGNFGWEDPVGSSGLVAWSGDGEKLYEHRPAGPLDAIVEFYSMNVSGSDDVWFHHDSEFSLVHLHLQKIVNQWAIPVSRSDGLAVSAGHALLRTVCGGRDTYHLFSIREKGRFKKVSEIGLRDQEGGMLAAERVVGRGDRLFLLSGDFLYRLDMSSM